jgi:hypothetical protein
MIPSVGRAICGEVEIGVGAVVRDVVWVFRVKLCQRLVLELMWPFTECV